MEIPADQTITWERVISFARQLEGAAWDNKVTPHEGSRLVRLLLDFNENIIGNVPCVARGRQRPR
jgi:hypothetical protein